MKEITKSVKEVVTTEKTVFVAFDGMVFDKKRECEDYEYSQKVEMLLNRPDVIQAGAGLPCNGAGYLSEDDEYYWLMPLTDDAVEAIIDTFESDWFNEADVSINQWMCVRVAYDYNETYSMNSIMNCIKSQFNELGYDVQFVPKKGE